MNKFKGLGRFSILWLGQMLSQLGSAMTATALTIWAFKQSGTVMSVALLCVCSYVPAALVSLFSGQFVDRHGKKAVMLAADTVSALTTLFVLIMSENGLLRVEYLYAINIIIGVAGAFQSPASNVAVSLLVPKEQYMRVSGMQSFSGSLQMILSPIFATSLLAFLGLRAVLITDLGSFVFAFVSLFILRLSETKSVGGAEEQGFIEKTKEGLSFLRKNAGIRALIWYLGIINLIAGIAYYSVLTPMVLARTGGNDILLGYVNSSIGIGMVCGALLLTVKSPKKHLAKQMCLYYMASFLLCDVWLGVGRSWQVWCAAAFLGNLPLPFGDGALSTIMRTRVPLDMQGRVFAVRDSAVKLATTAGYLIGAYLADGVCERLLMADNPVSAFLRAVIGTGEGRAMGIVFVLTGLVGVVSSIFLLFSRPLMSLDD